MDDSMSDLNDRRRRRRRGNWRGGRKERGLEKGELPPPQGLAKPPIILAKPPSDRDRERGTQSPPPATYTPNVIAMDRSSEDRDRFAPAPKTMIMLKSRGDRGGEDTAVRIAMAPSASIPSILANDSLPQPTYQIQRNPAVPTSTPLSAEGGGASRLAAAPDMMCGGKLVDEAFVWCDSPMEMLLDQTDFLSVGILGPQGAGKSTLLSLLAGNSHTDPQKSFVLRPQTKEIREVGAHQTLGIDMFITAERIMLLDTQAVLSSSILDHMIHHEKKLSTEYSSVENCLEMQSLMIATFLMTVCNVVIVVMDWFADLQFLRLVQTAEMLKPATPSLGHEGVSSDDSPEHFPHIVFVVNKATHDDFSAENYESMRDVLQGLFAQSKLRCKGGVSMANTGAIAGVTVPNPLTDFNLFLLPNMHQAQTSTHEGVLSLLPAFRGHPSFDHLIRLLRNHLFAMPRGMLTHATLSEKNWFHYAARTWEAIKKSSLLVEYNRLLP